MNSKRLPGMSGLVRPGATLAAILLLAQPPAGAGEASRLAEKSKRPPSLATLDPLAVAPAAKLIREGAINVPAAAGGQKPAAAARKALAPAKEDPALSARAAKAAGTCCQWSAAGHGLDRDCADALNALAKQASRLTAHSLKPAAEWLCTFLRQMNEPPLLTPMGGPYKTSKITNKLYWTQEGRIKAVVDR